MHNPTMQLAEYSSDGAAKASINNKTIFWRQEGEVGAPVFIAIHGWAASGDVWNPVREQLPTYGFLTVELPGFGELSSRLRVSLGEFVQMLAKSILEDELAQKIGSRDVFLLGWSLGGQVAAELAACIPSSIAGLITLASNPCFVAKNDWPQAMATDTFSRFCGDFEQNSGKTLKRFNALQSTGAQSPKILRAAMSACLPDCREEDSPLWLQGLSWLATDSRAALSVFDKPQLHLLAADDALVPSTVPLQQFGEVQVISNTSHCVPLERSEAVATAIRVFTKTHRVAALDKRKVARAFSAAAEQYDGFAQVQKIVADGVLARSQLLPSGLFADIGCGTGVLARGLASNQALSVLALDIAQGMLRFAKCQPSLGDIRFLAADAESLPLKDNSLDGVVSSLAIQWCSNLAVLFSELNRVLKPGGRAIIATLGPGTLRELKAAWQAVDDCVHINAFASQPCLRRAIEGVGLDITQFDVVEEKLCYASLLPLLKELKAIGAHNIHAQAPAGLMTRSKLKALSDAYPLTTGKAQSDVLEATYDVFYLELQKPLS